MLSEVETTIGQRIQAEMVRNRMSMRALSRKLQVAQPTIFKWVHGKAEPQLKHLRRMAEVLNVSPVWLLCGIELEKKEEETRSAVMIISEDGTKYVDSPSCLYFQVKSDEMSPTLEVGDTAVVDRNVGTIDLTGIYLVRVSGQNLLRRFCRAMDGTIRVRCDNTAKYPGAELLSSDDEHRLEIVGRVVSKVTIDKVN